MTERERETEHVLGMMERTGDRLPADWQKDFWTGSAWNIAEVLVQVRGLLTMEQKAVLLGAGAMMLRQAKLENDATAMTNVLLSRAQQNGGGK